MPTKGSVDPTSRQLSNDKNLVEIMKKSEKSSKLPSVVRKSDIQSTVKISLQEDFMCSPEDLYKVFVTDEVGYFNLYLILGPFNLLHVS